MLVRVRLGRGASWSGCELVRVRGCELTNRVRVDSGASWYWGELTRKPVPVGTGTTVVAHYTGTSSLPIFLFFIT